MKWQRAAQTLKRMGIDSIIPRDDGRRKPRRTKPCRKCYHPRDLINRDWQGRRWCTECGEYLD